MNFILYRTDHVNAFLHGDTVAMIKMSTYPVFLNGTKILTITFNAVTTGGYEVDLNAVSDSVYVNNPTLNTSELNNTDIIISPNPSSDKFNLQLANENIDQLIIYDSIGNEIIRKDNIGKSCVVEMSKYESGFYYLQCHSLQHSYTSKLILSH